MNIVKATEKITLEEIAKKIAKCQRCPLYKGTTNPVPGHGNPNAKVMFIGEAPGYHEDQQGIPFCGASGQLLDKLLALINIDRKDVFIVNILKHRPPNNRDPQPAEIEVCKTWLDQQIEIIQPKIIVTLGRFSMYKFMPDVKISQVHGQARYVNFNGQQYTVIPMFHPAAALRRGDVMVKIKEDFQKIPKFLEAQTKPMETNLTNTDETDKKDEQLGFL